MWIDDLTRHGALVQKSVQDAFRVRSITLSERPQTFSQQEASTFLISMDEVPCDANSSL